MNSKIKCPNCGYEFAVEDAYFTQAEEKIKKEYEKRISQQAAIFHKEKAALEKEKEEFQKKKDKENELFKQHLEKKLEDEKSKILKSSEDEFILRIKQLEEENEKRKIENKELKKKELELLKKENDLKEKQEEMKLELEKEMLEKRESIKSEAIKNEQQKSELKFKEYEKRLEDQMKLIEEMKRKAEQGSMQMQGEVQELILEDILKNNFPIDEILEVPKGISGADVIQKVKNTLGQYCGTIIWESKRTKNWSSSWIPKLKEDQRSMKAEIAVLLTSVLPPEIDIFGLIDNVWVTN
ncbi:MAG: DUF2130 domain-containing protein, partial [Candidatus Lokiarchaeota archaeon]|nr:DUF2130 domain-containing protein [Candidatus Lokiarchaeota archaeon]